jgi:hypothetical protein
MAASARRGTSRRKKRSQDSPTASASSPEPTEPERRGDHLLRQTRDHTAAPRNHHSDSSASGGTAVEARPTRRCRGQPKGGPLGDQGAKVAVLHRVRWVRAVPAAEGTPVTSPSSQNAGRWPAMAGRSRLHVFHDITALSDLGLPRSTGPPYGPREMARESDAIQSARLTQFRSRRRTGQLRSHTSTARRRRS